jgi:hypothetical protein
MRVARALNTNSTQTIKEPKVFKPKLSKMNTGIRLPRNFTYTEALLLIPPIDR